MTPATELQPAPPSHVPLLVDATDGTTIRLSLGGAREVEVIVIGDEVEVVLLVDGKMAATVAAGAAA
mgnify:CR=1 FL=1